MVAAIFKEWKNLLERLTNPVWEGII